MKNKPKNNIKNRKKNKFNLIVIMIAIIILCISFTSVFARYVVKKVNDFFLKSKEFYFNSDKLKDELAHYEIDNWSGVDTYTITVNMNSIDNNLNFTSYDIDYNISYECSNNAICEVSKENGTISASSHSDYFNVTITPNARLDTGDEVWVKIEAESTSQYTKKISGEFVLIVGKEDLSYEIADSVNNPYLELNITNRLSYYTILEAFSGYNVDDRIDRETYLSLSDEQKKKCYSALVTLEFNPADLILDMTNDNYLNASSIGKRRINGKEYISEITFSVEAITSTAVRFYKADKTRNYTYPIVNSNSVITVTSR